MHSGDLFRAAEYTGREFPRGMKVGYQQDDAADIYSWVFSGEEDYDDVEILWELMGYDCIVIWQGGWLWKQYVGTWFDPPVPWERISPRKQNA